MIARRKFEDIPTAPLFDMDRVPIKVSGGESSKRAKVVGWTKCPECVSHARVAVIRSANHLVYRPHDYPTWGGARMECRASGVALCQLKPKPYFAPNAIGDCPHA